MNPSENSITWQGKVISLEESLQWELPMVEVFPTVEGEGSKAGFSTLFVRVFHCNLRCTWCDTPYSYAPAEPEYTTTLGELRDTVDHYKIPHICLTGGEPLIHREKSVALIHHLASLEHVQDIHIETNGAIALEPFANLRQQLPVWQEKVRFVMDYKLPTSGEMDKMLVDNFLWLDKQDEIKFVIGSDEDFQVAGQVIDKYYHQGMILMSPVWESMHPQVLVEKILEHKLYQVKLNIQLHKIIWDPSQRGV